MPVNKENIFNIKEFFLRFIIFTHKIISRAFTFLKDNGNWLF
uniref:Uncharacterized protein n=1 Tax=Bartonella rochalimae ATCC BAA-1498 TaxID=685782 RepID=E6YK88_9HYPH|nr:hypothetical protein BARRO_10209 [Bartonella rochalimae ATCC BAA-1498]